MNKIKCAACGLTNWSSASHCLRCKTEIVPGAEGEFVHVPPQAGSKGGGSESKLTAIAVYGACGLMLLIAAFFVSSKSTSKGTGDTTAVAADSVPGADAPAAAGAEPGPPQGVTAPRIEGFDGRASRWGRTAARGAARIGIGGWARISGRLRARCARAGS